MRISNNQLLFTGSNYKTNNQSLQKSPNVRATSLEYSPAHDSVSFKASANSEAAKYIERLKKANEGSKAEEEKLLWEKQDALDDELRAKEKITEAEEEKMYREERERDNKEWKDLQEEKKFWREAGKKHSVTREPGEKRPVSPTKEQKEAERAAKKERRKSNEFWEKAREEYGVPITPQDRAFREYLQERENR